jgi:hypothetical protein
MLMKSFQWIGVSALLICFALTSCDKKSEGQPSCNVITLDQPFTARIGETWCRPADNWEITFGPFMEDSRCNVPDINCVWEGLYAMGATFDNGEMTQDTFVVIYGRQDTLTSGPFTVIVENVFPEMRTSVDPLDPSAYSFTVRVK